MTISHNRVVEMCSSCVLSSVAVTKTDRLRGSAANMAPHLGAFGSGYGFRVRDGAISRWPACAATDYSDAYSRRVQRG